MHRPSRQHKNVQLKLELKQQYSRLSGKKARRWKKAVEKYQSVVESA